MGVPSVSASPSVAAKIVYNEALSNSPFEVFSGRGNLYGLLVENNGASDCFIQIFDKAVVGDVTLGTTVPDLTFRVPASGAFGKDVNDSPLRYFSKGCIVAVTGARTTNAAPAAPATATFWHESRQGY